VATQTAEVRFRGGYTALQWFGVLVVVSAPLGCASKAANDLSTGGSSGTNSGVMPSGGTTSTGIGGGTANTGGTAAGAGETGGGGTSGGAINTGGTTNAGGTSMGGEATGGDTNTGGTTNAGGTSMGGEATGGNTNTGGTTNAGGTSMGGEATGGNTNTGGTTYPYILSCFDDDNSHASDLMIYTSNDALNWTLLYDTGYTGPTGFMRDPSIMRHTDGKYYVAFTTPPDLSCCSDEQSFSIGSSSNLKDWTTIATVPCGVPGTKNTWSPEWFVDSDGSVHLTATLDLKIYHYEPTDSTLTKWGPPTAMNISGTLDAQVLKIGSTYHMILPNRHGTAPSFDGPWTWNSNLLPPACKEGPAMVHISGNTWRYYCDDGGNGHERSSLYTDLFQTWSSLDTLPVVGDNISQGTVIRGDTGHPF
jgi:hypothetical protein